jgi:hypothetical protein
VVTKPTPNFRRVLADLSQGNILTTTIRSALFNPQFKGFDLHVDAWEEHPPDRWFHPSTHSSWTARQLYYYLKDPESFPHEAPDLLFVLAVTQGKFWHTFVQKLLLDQGILTQDEIPLIDLEFNRRGHADGVLSTGELFEFKTASENVIKMIKDVDGLRHYKPTYYSQAQDYLDMSGHSAMRYLIMSLASPFPMAEYVVKADPQFQAAQRAKYREALSAYQEGREPEACCAIYSPQAKACPARTVCPIGKASS